MADAVANYVLDARLESFAWFNEAMGHRLPARSIFVVSTDAAFRRAEETQPRSAAGVVTQAFLVDPISSELTLVTLAVVGRRLGGLSDSVEAEFEAALLGMDTFVDIMHRCCETE